MSGWVVYAVGLVAWVLASVIVGCLVGRALRFCDRASAPARETAPALSVVSRAPSTTRGRAR